MIIKIFAIHDAKAAAFLLPFFQMTTGLAIRAFSDSCNNVEHNFCRHAEDYTLFQMGTYDDGPGSFEMLPTPLPVRKAIEVKTQTEMPLAAPLLREVNKDA